MPSRLQKSTGVGRLRSSALVIKWSSDQVAERMRILCHEDTKCTKEERYSIQSDIGNSSLVISDVCHPEAAGRAASYAVPRIVARVRTPTILLSSDSLRMTSFYPFRGFRAFVASNAPGRPQHVASASFRFGPPKRLAVGRKLLAVSCWLLAVSCRLSA